MKICTDLICWGSFFSGGVCKRQSIPRAGKVSAGGNVLEIIRTPQLLEGKEQTCLLSSWIKVPTKGLAQWLSRGGRQRSGEAEAYPSPSSLLSHNHYQSELFLLTAINQGKCGRKTDQEYWARTFFVPPRPCQFTESKLGSWRYLWEKWR